MNWEAIGAIGESLGAIGVIVTVIYVALQIRQNSEAVRGATEQNLMSQEMALYALLAEHANVYRRGRSGLDNLAQCPRSCANRPDFQSVLVLVVGFHLQYVPYI